MKNRDYSQDLKVTCILHSSFFILHSSFFIRHSIRLSLRPLTAASTSVREGLNVQTLTPERLYVCVVQSACPLQSGSAISMNKAYCSEALPRLR